MRFANPEWLMLLWAVPAIWVIAGFTARRARARLERGLGSRMTPLLAKQVSPGRRRMKTIARSMALALAIVALARPQSGKGISEIKVRGVELMIALDVSTSMLAEDVKPSRLQFAKSELTRLLDLLAGDKVGLIGFAGSALLLSPLTNDISSLKMFLDSLSPYSIATQGTFFTQALQEAADAFERGGTEDDDRSKTTRVILILSDGEDQEKGALELAKKLASQGIRIFTIAFGTERGGMIPIRDERGYLRSYKKERNGKEVVSTVKGEFLKDLARVGQGSFHFASFGGNEARAVKADIDKLQKAEFASSMATQYEERFQLFLLASLVLILLDLLIGERSAADRVWRGRFEAGLKSIAWWMLLLSFQAATMAPSRANASDFKGVRENNTAVGKFKGERYSEALDGFTKALSDLPDSAEVHYNVGAGFMANKDDVKALSEFDVALKMNPSADIAFKAHFNRGVILGGQKKVAEALESYQRALEVKPDSVETKTNIELLIKSGEGEGEGEGESKPNDKPQDGKDKKPQDGKDQKPQDQPQQGPTPKPTPKPFKSDQLNQQDVGRILEELKRQEDQIREKMQREGGKEAPRDKDW